MWVLQVIDMTGVLGVRRIPDRHDGNGDRDHLYGHRPIRVAAQIVRRNRLLLYHWTLASD